MGFIKDIIKHFKAEASGVTIEKSVTHSYTERELITRMKRGVNEIVIDQNQSYHDYSRELGLDALLIELLDQRLAEIEENE